MIEPFSEAYYISELTIEEYSGDDLCLPWEIFETISYQVYESDEPIPLILKINGVHATVAGESGIPHNTLAVPSEYTDLIDVDAPETTSVLVAKKKWARKIAHWFIETEV